MLLVENKMNIICENKNKNKHPVAKYNRFLEFVFRPLLLKRHTHTHIFDMFIYYIPNLTIKVNYKNEQTDWKTSKQEALRA